MFVDYKRSTYDDYTYPVWADVLGWFFTLVSVLAIPIMMLSLLSKETEGDNLLEVWDNEENQSGGEREGYTSKNERAV